MSHKQQVKHTVEKQNNDTHQSNEKTDKETIKREFFKCLHNVHQKYIDK
jgi:hypothetical protein